jgi:hypothetical protein
MRTTTRFGVLLLAGLASVVVGVVPAIAATPAQPGVPTCLITNGGNGGHYSKAMTCVELVSQRYGSVGTGRYNPGPGYGQHSVTVTLEYQKAGYGHHDNATWVSLTSATKRGNGNLTVMTRPTKAPRSAQLRACVAVDSSVHHQGSQVCTRS